MPIVVQQGVACGHTLVYRNVCLSDTIQVNPPRGFGGEAEPPLGSPQARGTLDLVTARDGGQPLGGDAGRARQKPGKGRRRENRVGLPPFKTPLGPCEESVYQLHWNCC